LIWEAKQRGIIDLTKLPDAFSELKTIFDRWAQSLQQYRDNAKRIAYIGKEMPGLLKNRLLFKKILADIVQGGNYPDTRQATLFPNELVVFINARRLFSVRLYIYASGQFTPIHDHNSWGVYGCVSQKVEVIRYRRTDDESTPGCACLQEIERLFLQPGETTSVLPLNDGIHRAGNPDHQTAVMLSVYGTPIRRLYVNQFDFAQNTVSKRFPPRLHKKMLAAGALDAMGSLK